MQEVRDGGLPLTYVYADPDSFAPLARIDGLASPEIFWCHSQPNDMPEWQTNAEGRLRWEGRNGAWGKLLRERPLPDSASAQNLRTQGQYPDRDKFSGRKFEQRKGLTLRGESNGCGEYSRTALQSVPLL